ncbi:putative coatomer subunit epsilon [Nadsonia fulvescens var. elongata DSM 6958]|uniref:Coatomer subunit epsilon n=1 Tax=Nadsonia fulvescens var. elongata DSM 6958 TaxID=857566 RepID=A0A1E3PEZ0_9ASCO|nr:putative coatomer subunit epsilon [Nadsonia fulvescens var. elongata DSM 6958]
MDPFSDNSELFHIYKAFFTGAYETVLAVDSTHFSEVNQEKAFVYKLRSKLALGDIDEAIAELQSSPTTPSTSATLVYAMYLKGDRQAVTEIESLVHQNEDNEIVLVLAGIILANEGRYGEALQVLNGHQGSLEAISVIVRIHLGNNNTEAAFKEIQAAKKWAQDNIIYNLAEAWVCCRIGGEKFQQAYYIFEEQAQSSESSVRSIVSQAITELQLGRIPEAQDNIQRALEINSQDPDVLTAAITCAILMDKPVEEYESALESVDPSNRYLQDLKEKEELFERVSAKYADQISGY